MLRWYVRAANPNATFQCVPPVWTNILNEVKLFQKFLIFETTVSLKIFILNFMTMKIFNGFEKLTILKNHKKGPKKGQSQITNRATKIDFENFMHGFFFIMCALCNLLPTAPNL